MIGGIHLSEAFNPVCPRRPAPNAIADMGRMYDGSDQPSGCGLIDGVCLDGDRESGEYGGCDECYWERVDEERHSASRPQDPARAEVSGASDGTEERCCVPCVCDFTRW